MFTIASPLKTVPLRIIGGFPCGKSGINEWRHQCRESCHDRADCKTDPINLLVRLKSGGILKAIDAILTALVFSAATGMICPFNFEAQFQPGSDDKSLNHSLEYIGEKS